jgi:hypothetical protein
MEKSLDPMKAAWAELKGHLERRCAELNEEVRNYPTPIARCDEQLTRLIEQRSRAVEQLKLVAGADPAQASAAGECGLAALDQVLTGPPASADDDVENAIRARARAALAGLRNRL